MITLREEEAGTSAPTGLPVRRITIAGPLDHFAMRNPSVPLDASTTIIPSNAMNAIEYGAALRRSVDSDPGSLIAVAAIARF